MKRAATAIFAGFLLMAGMQAWASSSHRAQVDRLIAQKDAPPGVVFEIVQGDAQALEWAIPEVARQAKRLRERFPKLDIAVVTHGREMFALQTDQRTQNPQVHAAVEQLAKQEGVPVHVCETYAGWKGVGAEAFPAYVNVAPAGPTQINNYRALGYVLVKLDKP